MADVVFTDQNFQKQVLESKIPVVVDFWAPWCAPCKIIAPLLETLATDYQGKILIGKMNADENPHVIETFSVMSMPTVMFFKNGQPVKALIGSQGKTTYQRTIEEVLAA